MNETFTWWLLIAGIGIGIAIAWLVMGRLPRSDEDVSVEERAAEATWISRSIAAYGGAASPALVEEILDLHQQYLEGPGVDPRSARGAVAIPDPDLDSADVGDDLAYDDDPYPASGSELRAEAETRYDATWPEDDPDDVGADADADGLGSDELEPADMERDEPLRSPR